MLLQRLKQTAFYLLLAFIGLLAVYGVGRLVQVWSDSFYQGAREPYLQMPAATAVTLRWQSPGPVQASIRYGESASQLDQQVQEKTRREQHEIRLTGLQPDTRYYYAVYHDGQPAYQGPDYRFRTAPQTGTARPVRIWVTGDQGYPGPAQQEVREAALNWVQRHPRPGLPELDIWITTGDNAYRSGSNQQFQNGFFEPYRKILRQVAVWPAYGNHDARRWVFFELFTLPQQAESGGLASGSERYYAFDYANLHVVMLDTQSSELAQDSPMLKWLKQDLATTRQPWKIAVFHHPPYTRGSHNSDDMSDSDGRMFEIRRNVLPLLEQAGVQLVLSGHSHMYERSYPLHCHYGTSDSLSDEMIINRQSRPGSVYGGTGTVYVVIGSSSKVDAGPLDHPAMPVSHASLGSLIIDVTADSIRSRFVDEHGEVKDRFVVKRNDAGSETRLNCR